MLALVTLLALVSCTADPVPIIAAHRGGMDSGYPENTLPAFGHAAATGAQVIELDLRATADGHPVVLHDASVDRTTDGSGLVQHLTLAALQRLRTGGAARVPTLHDVLTATRALDITLLLDLKPAPGLDLGAVARAVRADYDPAKVLFGVRALEDQQRLAATGGPLRYLGFVPDPQSVDAFLGAGVTAIRLWPAWLARDPQLVARVKQAGGQVWVTTGSAPIAELRRLTALGVDALLTDHPAAAVASLGCRGRPVTG